jgi:endonuclease/exonuclease/phosphatase family metal-dependent hydrolase
MSCFRILSLNIHKGFSTYNRRFILPDLREAFRSVGADLIFLQEVHGKHEGHAARIEDWPDESQTEFLADQVWSDFAYGRNAIYQEGDHGNAILSKFVIGSYLNTDISISPRSVERRGFLYGKICLPDGNDLHAICLHLSLTAKDRACQFAKLKTFVEENVSASDRLIIAGDFNDWTLKARSQFAQPLALNEAFQNQYGREARTFPSFFPVLRLDRVYYRGLRFRTASVLKHAPWSSLSDHVGLLAEFEL